MHRACWPEATWFLGACTTLLDITSTRGWSITLRNAHADTHTHTHTHTHAHTHIQLCISGRRSVIVKSCTTSCLSNTHTGAKLLYYILNQGVHHCTGERTSHLSCYLNAVNRDNYGFVDLTNTHTHTHTHTHKMLYWPDNMDVMHSHTPLHSMLITRSWTAQIIHTKYKRRDWLCQLFSDNQIDKSEQSPLLGLCTHINT